MKTKLWMVLQALLLCMGMGAFFMPVTVQAGGPEDTTPPEISAMLEGETLHITVSDDYTGVEAVYIGGRRVNCRMQDNLDVRLADFVTPKDQGVAVYAVDYAGNRSRDLEIENPLYAGSADRPQEETGTGKTGETDTDGTGKPDGLENTDTETEIPGGQASLIENVSESGREFYTFSTPAGNVFYLVIDKERDSENVYFLNAVTESDLAALAEIGEQKLGGGSVAAVPEAEAVCICTDKCEAGKVNLSCPVCRNDLAECKGKETEAEVLPQEPERGEVSKENKGSTATAILVLLVVLVIGGGGYYLKIYKPKHELDDAEELDELLPEYGGKEVDEDAEDEADADSYGSGTDGREDTDGYGAEADDTGNGNDVEDGTEPEESGTDGEPGQYADGYAGADDDGQDTADWDDYPDEGPGQGE